MKVHPTGLLLVALAPLAACERGEVRESRVVTVAARHDATPDAPAVPAPAIPAERPVTAAEAAAPTPALRPTKDFTDPPLPQELTDDGGLMPLPPRPRPASIPTEEVER